MKKQPVLNLATLPRVIVSHTLMARRVPGEGTVEVLMHGAGTTTPFLVGGRTNKQFRFEWNSPRLCHVLRCPVSLWNSGIAKELLDQLKLSYPLVPLFHAGASVAEEPSEAVTSSTGADSVTVTVKVPPAPAEAKEEPESTSADGMQGDPATASIGAENAQPAPDSSAHETKPGVDTGGTEKEEKESVTEVLPVMTTIPVDSGIPIPEPRSVQPRAGKGRR